MNPYRLLHIAGRFALLLIVACSVARAEDNQLLIIDGVATNFPGYPLIIGDTGTNNYLIITNGGTVTSAGVWVGNNASASDNGMFVTGANSSYEGPAIVGSYGSGNKLILSLGGMVHSSSAEVGAYYGSSGNTVIVDGPNSVWTIDSILDVGWCGTSNELLVVNGGRVNSNGPHSSVGNSNGSHDNLVQVSGSNSVWSGLLEIGFYGTNNRLLVSEGGHVTNSEINLSVSSYSASNVVTVTGSGSRIDAGSVKVGEVGSSNLLEVCNGATVVAGGVYVGMSGSRSNVVSVSDSNSTFTVISLSVGYQTSDCTVKVSDGGSLISGSVSISGTQNNGVQVSNGILEATNLFSAGTGVLQLDGGECRFNQLTCNPAPGGGVVINSGLIVVTQSSTINYGTNSFAIGTATNEVGTLKLLPGSHSLFADNGILLGPSAGSRGELFIAGPNALARGPLYVGDTGWTHGSGSALITGGAVFEANTIVCGSNNLDSIVSDGGILQFTIPNPSVASLAPNGILLTNGTISFRNITNADPQYFLSSPLSINFEGTNSFRLFNSASVLLDTYEFGASSNNLYAGLILTNGLTQWRCTNTLIGAGGELFCSGTVPTIGVPGGTLAVTNGGRVKNAVGVADFNRSISNFSLTITGAGTQWTNWSDFAVGYQGASNHCLVDGGATLQDQTGYLGYSIASSNNDISVFGASSLWLNASGLTVGQSGSRNALYIEDGGEVRSARMTIGANSSSVSNRVQIAYGSLVVTNTSKNAILAVQRGDLNLQGGTIVTDQLIATNGSSGRIAFNRGIIFAKGAAINNGAPFVVGDGVQPAMLELGGGNFSFANGLVISSNAVLRGYGNILNNVTNYGTITADQSGAELSFKAYVDNHGGIMATNGGGFFQLTGISKTNASVQIIMEGVRGLSFTLEYKDSLFDGDWTTVTSVPVTNSPLSIIDSNALAPTRVYRVRAQ